MEWYLLKHRHITYYILISQTTNVDEKNTLIKAELSDVIMHWNIYKILKYCKEAYMMDQVTDYEDLEKKEYITGFILPDKLHPSSLYWLLCVLY